MYVRQGDEISCGPTAILNLLEWLGHPMADVSLIPYLQFGCRTIDLEDPDDEEDSGTTSDDFDRVLRYVAKGAAKIRRIEHPTLKTLIKHLDRGSAVALSYHWESKPQFGDHFCVLLEIKSSLFVTVNDHDCDGSPIRKRTAETIEKWLRKNDAEPTAWIVTAIPRPKDES